MTYIDMSLQSLPEIGFAHHFYAENYQQSYKIQDNSFEIVYVKTGKLGISFNGQSYEAIPGTIFILCRHLPIQVKVMDNIPHSHSSIQLRCKFSSRVFHHSAGTEEYHSNILLPMIFPPSQKSQQIGLKIDSIIAKLQSSRAYNAQGCVLAILGILAELDSACREQISAALPSSLLLSSKLKAFIETHIQEDLTLDQLANFIGRSPNYLNTVFKQVTGIPIRQYINRRKAILIAELMIYKNASLRVACENVGILDISYGHRLFKKQMGTTPHQYLETVYAKAD